MKFQTINEYIAAVTNNEMTAVDAASDMFPKMGYAVEYYRVSSASERPALQAIKAAYNDLENGVTVKTAAVPEIQVECSCGHTVSKINVMTTSAGTSCPDCYDRMSDEVTTTTASMIRTKTEEDFAAEYAEELVRTGEVQPGVEVDEDEMCNSTVSIPEGDYDAMVDSGIENPSARKYWRGYNRYMRSISEGEDE
jgi:hypothetical protein